MVPHDSMSRRWLVCCALCIGMTAPGALLGRSPAFGQTVGRRTAASGLVVVPGERVAAPMPGSGRLDFGRVDPLRQPQIEQTFTLKNASSAPILLERIQPSCGCTTLVLGDRAGSPAPKRPAGSEPGLSARSPDSSAPAQPVARTLAPGETLAFRAALDTRHLQPGRVDKFVWVFTPEKRTPAVTIQLSGEIEELVSLEPNSLSLGKIPVSLPPKLTVTAKLDPRLVQPEHPLLLTASLPHLVVTPDGNDRTETDKTGRRYVLRSFTVTLAPRAPLGVLFGTLALSLPHEAGNAPSGGMAEDIRAILTNATVSVLGEITGKISATPNLVVFGAIAPGQKEIRQIVLSAKTQEVLRNLKVKSSHPGLLCRLKPSAPVQPSGSAGEGQPAHDARTVLEITVETNIAPGSTPLQIVISTPDGEHLLIPVVLTASETAGSRPSPTSGALPAESGAGEFAPEAAIALQKQHAVLRPNRGADLA